MMWKMTVARLVSVTALGVLTLVASSGPATGGSRDPADGRDEATWYYFDWMADAPYAPTFEVLDTESSLGPYAKSTKHVTLKDLIRMHGHPCDGLVTAACALRLGFDHLYPDGIIDRTDTACITNNSPCYGDVAAYLTGGRIRFGTQKIDSNLGNEFILYRMSTGDAVRVVLKPGVFPDEVARFERKIRSGEFTAEEMRTCQRLQWTYAKDLLRRPPDDSFTVVTLDGFLWKPDSYVHLGKRGDVLNKDVRE